MKRAVITMMVMMAAATAGAPAVARDDLSPRAVAVQNWRLARVRAAGQTSFLDGVGTPGCPSLASGCRRAAFVVKGDLVLIGDTKGPLVETVYSDPRGITTTGWLPRGSLDILGTPRQGDASWRGEWRHDGTKIDIMPGAGPGRLKASGMAEAGAREGQAHSSWFKGEAVLTGDHILFSSPGVFDGDCRVSLRLIGPYLVGADNMNCRVFDASFSGVYRRTSDR